MTLNTIPDVLNISVTDVLTAPPNVERRTLNIEH
jgi:hypothetical protein